jgi:ATP-dependent protease ClpP protease subunit
MLKFFLTQKFMLLSCSIMLFLYIFFSSPLFAANVLSQKSDDRECEFLLQGEIRTGDSDQLSKQIESRHEELELNGTYFERLLSPSYICLDSPGGSLLEGVEIAKIIKKYGLSTRIPHNSECLSACSIAFMAGSFGHPEGEVSFTKRTMHPTARLGFHAPSLNIQQGQYNEESVEKAYDVALQAVAAVSDLRVSSIEEFPESIFIKFLRTPSSTFTYIDTLGAATRLGITISPVPVFTGKLGAAAINLCENASSRYSDIDIEEYWPLGGRNEFEDMFKVVDGRIVYDGGFYEEASVSCIIDQFGWSEVSDHDFRVSFPDAMGAFPVYQSSFGASATYPPTTLISELPVASKSQTVSRVKLINTIPSKPSNLSCGVADRNTRIINVQNYTNLRKEAGLNGRVIGQISLGETVSVVNPGNFLRYDRCAAACDGANQKNQPAIKVCIDNNDVWIEVLFNGRKGFVSRKFLQ